MKILLSYNTTKKFQIIICFTIIIVLLTGCSFHIFAAGRNQEEIASLKGRLSLFQKALDEFGAISPEQAANLWAKGVKNRNGALQYAVMDNKLKEKFSNILEKERQSWVTGGSSPWVETYKIFSSEKKDETTYEIIVRFKMMTSYADMGSYNANLLIEKEDNYWGIKNIEMESLLKKYLRYPDL